MACHSLPVLFVDCVRDRKATLVGARRSTLRRHPERLRRRRREWYVGGSPGGHIVRCIVPPGDSCTPPGLPRPGGYGVSCSPASDNQTHGGRLCPYDVFVMRLVEGAHYRFSAVSTGRRWYRCARSRARRPRLLPIDGTRRPADRNAERISAHSGRPAFVCSCDPGSPFRLTPSYDQPYGRQDSLTGLRTTERLEFINRLHV